MPKIRVAEGEIYYEAHGRGTPVLLVPGLGGVSSYSKMEYSGLFEGLSGHSYTTMGHRTKQSLPHPLWVDQMVDDFW